MNDTEITIICQNNADKKRLMEALEKKSSISIQNDTLVADILMLDEDTIRLGQFTTNYIPLRL